MHQFRVELWTPAPFTWYQRHSRVYITRKIIHLWTNAHEPIEVRQLSLASMHTEALLRDL